MERVAMSKDFDYFLEHPEEFEQLSAEDQAKLAEGRSIEGEISSVPPDAAAADETNPEQQQVDPAEANSDPPEAPVVLAKDGKHTIPFEELQAAREQARYWQAKAEEALAQQQVETPPEQTTPPVDLKELRRELREAVLSDDEEREAEIQDKIDAELTLSLIHI
jgi:hypothetical protein